MFNPSTSVLTHWTVGPAVLQFTVPGQIQNHNDAAGRRFVFVTDAPHNRIGMLDITGARYLFWNVAIAPAASTPHALAVDHLTGQVWFTTYDGVNPPAVAVLTPSAGVVTIDSWTLPAAIAVPGNQLDGIVVTRASGALLVYVAIPQRNELLEINATAGPVRTWSPLRYTRPTRLAVNSAGEIFAPNATSNLVLRFRPSINLETLWTDGPFVFSPYISMDSTDTPFLPASNAGSYITNLNPIGGTMTSVAPTPFAPVIVGIATATNVVAPGVSTVVLPTMALVPPSVPVPPFTNWSVPGNGPLSCDPTAALRDTWFIDVAANRIARFRP
jgi:hypothetical protein